MFCRCAGAPWWCAGTGMILCRCLCVALQVSRVLFGDVLTIVQVYLCRFSCVPFGGVLAFVWK